MKSVEFKNFEKLEYIMNEQFNSLGVNIKFSGKNKKVICITGSSENVGKSFVSLHLARKYASDGLKVLLIDADLRKSRLVRDYNVQGVDEITGLSHYLSGQAEIEDIIYSTNIKNMYVAFAGHNVPNPTVLLDGDRFDLLLDMAREKYDMIIVDTPPILPVIDTVIVAPKCDGVMFVIEFGYTRRQEIIEAKKQLEVSRAKILGTILNKVPTKINKYSYYKKYYRGNYSYKSYKNSGYNRTYGYGRIYGDVPNAD